MLDEADDVGKSEGSPTSAAGERVGWYPGCWGPSTFSRAVRIRCGRRT